MNDTASIALGMAVRALLRTAPSPEEVLRELDAIAAETTPGSNGASQTAIQMALMQYRQCLKRSNSPPISS